MLPLAEHFKVLGCLQAGDQALEDGYKEAAQAGSAADAAQRHGRVNTNLRIANIRYVN
jgi:hypothetical protein